MLLEVLVATLIAAMAVAGMQVAFMTAARQLGRGGGPAFAEASIYAQQTAEKFRNLIAADSPWRTSGPPVGWQLDAFDGPADPSPSIRSSGAARRYRVTTQDCDLVGGPGDCYAIEVRVCWNDPSC